MSTHGNYSISRNYSPYLLQQWSHFYIIIPSGRTFWTPVHYHDDEALKEAAKEWLEGQTEVFYLVEWRVCQKNVANAFNSVKIILKNKM